MPLAAGMTLYGLFRGIPALALTALLAVNHHNSFMKCVLYNVPDGLWLYALLQGLRNVWRSELFSVGLPWLIIVITGAVCSEFLQYFHLIPGTFDLLDIAAYLFAVAIFTLQYHQSTQTLKSAL
jgi:hypothetical protein